MHRNGLLVLFWVDAEHVVDACQHAVAELVKRDMIAGEHANEVEDVLSAEADYGVGGLNHHVAMVTGQLDTPGDDVNVLLRLNHPITVGDEQECWFIWILLSQKKTHAGMAKAAEFGKLLDDDEVLREALAAKNEEELFTVYEKTLDDEVHFAGQHIPPELIPSGRFAVRPFDEVTPEVVDRAVIANVHHAVQRVRNESAVWSDLEREGAIRIVGAMCDIETCIVRFLD